MGDKKFQRRSVLQGFMGLGAGALAGRILGDGLFVGPALGPPTQEGVGCWLTPAKTEGPYYFNPNLIRQDIRESKTGIPFNLGIRVVDINCTPIPNLLIDVWHCDKDGLYSGYNQPGGNTTGQTFLRGTQPTDIDGLAVFQTIYPGWYQGRATHIHFKVRIPDLTYVTSQFCFDDAVNNAVYATPLYSTRGANPTTNASDGIFGTAHPQYLEIDVAPNGSGGYDGVFDIGISANLSIFSDGFEAGDLSAWSAVF